MRYVPACICHRPLLNVDYSARNKEQEEEKVHYSMEGYSHISVDNLLLQHELRIARLRNYDSFMCPCCDCKGGIRKSTATVKQHLRRRPRDPFLFRSMVGDDPEEGFPPEGIWIPTSEGM
jgi:hypothetical protein